MITETAQAFFSALVHQPANLNTSNEAACTSLQEQFPYCQIIQFAGAKMKQSPDLAGIYAPDRTLLQQFFYEAESLKAIELETEAEILEKILVQEPEQEEEQNASVQAEMKLREQPVEEKNSIDDTQQLILESIASADFFALEEKVTAQPAETPSQEISRYDDDQMPYTFLWWLNKTRKEHAETYQPYASFKLDTTQDIKKNVSEEPTEVIPDFDLQTLAAKPLSNQFKTTEKPVKRKEDELIERFIKEDPHIAPPSAEKMGTENKARKSSEDVHDLVSETLAQIYTEQMLLDKAIETYRKLSLKFPEKSTYFADQISVLESRKN